MTPSSPTFRKRFSSSIPLWVRADQPRNISMNYWKGPHSKIISASPGLADAAERLGIVERELPAVLVELKAITQDTAKMPAEAVVFELEPVEATLKKLGRSLDF